jgi:hypothetical protein
MHQPRGNSHKNGHRSPRMHLPPDPQTILPLYGTWMQFACVTAVLSLKPIAPVKLPRL